jgi:hypothetical protein
MLEARMTNIETRISIPNDVLFQNLDGEAVLLNLQSGKYFGLDPVGTRVWNLLVEYGTLPTTYQTLLEEYEVDAERLQSDLLALVDQLNAHGLIRLNEPSKDES